MAKVFEEIEEKMCSDYRSWIIEMVEKIEEEEYLANIYSFVKVFWDK